MERSIDEVKKLISNLQNQTVDRGASETEAQIASQLIQKLLIKHHLELNDIKEEDVKNREAIRETIFSSGRLMWYDESLVAVMHKFYFVSIYKTRSGRNTSIIAVGFPEDIETFKSIYTFCNNIMKSVYKIKSKQNPVLNRNDFYDGFIHGIKNALEDNTNKMKEEFETALVPVKDAIEKAMPNKLSNRKKTGIKPKFENDINSFSEGYLEGKNAYKEFDNHGKRIS